MGPNMDDFEHLFNVKPTTPLLNIIITVKVIKMQFKPLLIPVRGPLLRLKETRRYDPNDDARVRLLLELLDNKLTHTHSTKRRQTGQTAIRFEDEANNKRRWRQQALIIEYNNDMKSILKCKCSSQDFYTFHQTPPRHFAKSKRNVNIRFNKQTTPQNRPQQSYPPNPLP